MCGIVGFCGFDDSKLLKRMCDVIIHRGPDDKGYYIDKDISLGNRRLSIIDLTSGKQPIYNEDRSVVVVYNGEIYNFKEIRKDLEKKGHKFSTNSDTEV
jgi:asparagine synthase (glutamine-hydrolysing)